MGAMDDKMLQRIRLLTAIPKFQVDENMSVNDKKDWWSENVFVLKQSRETSVDELKQMLLKRPSSRLSSFFCFHSWVYWGINFLFSRERRVCKKCGKRQVYDYRYSDGWRKDDVAYRLETNRDNNNE